MKKQILSTVLASLLLAGTTYAEKGTEYISPNNDGVKDQLSVPLKIKEKRYVASWAFIIEDENGNLVRKIGNKDKRPTSVGVKTFFKQIITPKSGVLIPEEVIWDGRGGSDDPEDIEKGLIKYNGENVPDGTYFYYMVASDDNGNTSTSKKFKVVVDNTAPEVTLKQPSSDDKIFGEGAKSLFTVRQEGSVEDEWVATFADADGKIVKTIKWTNSSPEKFDWNGTNDAGSFVNDGIYSYKVEATDRAGNKSNPVAISNIIYSAEKPATNITLVTGKYFSPNGDNLNDAVSFEVKIPAPDKAKTGNALVEWSVKIYGADGKVYRTFEGKDTPVSMITFDGKDDSGKIIADGSYQARLVAKYLNGYVTPALNSPIFMLDTQAPSVSLALSSETFGGGDKTSLEIKHTTIKDNGSPIKNWKGVITDANGSVVKSYDFGSFMPVSISWDGTKMDNSRASDGSFFYTLTASDEAGNALSLKSRQINLDTSKAELFLTATPAAFNSTKTSLTFAPVIKQAGSKVVEYTLTVTDRTKKTVWTSKGSSLPSTISWNGLDSTDGTRLADGQYNAEITAKFDSGSVATASSQTITIDTVAPSVELSVPYTMFSPDGDKLKDTLPVAAKTSKEAQWNITVKNAKNEPVYTVIKEGSVSAFEWDGTDDAGNSVADGTYKVVFAATDLAGNSNSAEIANIVVDKRETKAYVTLESDAISPNGDNILDTQKFSIRTTLTEGIESWNFDIATAEGKVVRSWSNKDQKNLPAEIKWDGIGNDGNVVTDNAYTGKLNLVYTKGNVVNVTSSLFISCITPPQLSIKTAPKYFSPDNDGENDDLYIQLKRKDGIVPLKNWSFQINDPQNGKSFWKISGKSAITEKVVWDGRGNNGELVQSAMDYPYVFTATDELGMTSRIEGVIAIDVLVIRDKVGNLKIAVPSIIFRKDHADFETGKDGITEAQKKNNERVLNRIADILNKFKNYKVIVEGHANNVTGTASEAEELVPLSKQRADFVKKYLEKKGIDSSRLTTEGKGGKDPVVSHTDRDNWWKNRRVEFKLNKN